MSDYAQNNIIAAIATPRGNAAIAVIRVSGEGAIELCDGVFAPLRGGPLALRRGWTCALGEIRDGGERGIYRDSADVDGCWVDDGVVRDLRARVHYADEFGNGDDREAASGSDCDWRDCDV